MPMRASYEPHAGLPTEKVRSPQAMWLAPNTETGRLAAHFEQQHCVDFKEFVPPTVLI